MAEITTDQIKRLRERTGVGIGKCKEALQEAAGDLEEAISILRKAGIASAVKKEGREANEGKIGFAESDQSVALAEVNAETDFVSSNKEFAEFLRVIAEEAAATQPDSLEAFLQQKFSKDPNLTVDEYRATAVQKIGENIQIGRVMNFKKESGKTVGVYSHMGGKIVSAVVIEGSGGLQDFARDIAMHAAAAAPDYLDAEHVPPSTVEHEKEIARSQIKNKPENIIDKILEGKLNAFYDSVCLVRQHFIKDDKKTIGKILEEKSKEIGKPLKIVTFVRWAVGQK